MVFRALSVLWLWAGLIGCDSVPPSNDSELTSDSPKESDSVSVAPDSDTEESPPSSDEGRDSNSDSTGEDDSAGKGEGDTGSEVEPDTGSAVEPDTGSAVEPDTGSEVEPDTGSDSDSDGSVSSAGRCDGGRELVVREARVGSGIEVCPNTSFHRFEAASCGPIPDWEVVPEDELPYCGEECAAGELCLNSGWIVPWCVRLCVTDADCPEDEACLCAFRESGWMPVGYLNMYSQCVPAGCKTDADCGAHRCGVIFNGCGNAYALACHTDSDKCEGARDCITEDNYNSMPFCTQYSALGDAWRCSAANICD